MKWQEAKPGELDRTPNFRQHLLFGLTTNDRRPIKVPYQASVYEQSDDARRGTTVAPPSSLASENASHMDWCFI